MSGLIFTASIWAVIGIYFALDYLRRRRTYKSFMRHPAGRWEL